MWWKILLERIYRGFLGGSEGEQVGIDERLGGGGLKNNWHLIVLGTRVKSKTTQVLYLVDREQRQKSEEKSLFGG